jgi:hypothetical protein
MDGITANATAWVRDVLTNNIVVFPSSQGIGTSGCKVYLIRANPSPSAFFKGKEVEIYYCFNTRIADSRVNQSYPHDSRAIRLLIMDSSELITLSILSEFQPRSRCSIIPRPSPAISICSPRAPLAGSGLTPRRAMSSAMEDK